MSDLSREEEEALERAIAPLRVKFRSGLGSRLADLEARLAAARAGDGDKLGEARELAHALHGTAGTYGLRDVSDAAAVIEHALVAHFEDPGGLPDWRAIDAALARIRAEVEAS